MLLFTQSIISNVLKIKLQEMDNKGQSARCQYNEWDCIKLEIWGKGEIHFFSMIDWIKWLKNAKNKLKVSTSGGWSSYVGVRCPLKVHCIKLIMYTATLRGYLAFMLMSVLADILANITATYWLKWLQIPGHHIGWYVVGWCASGHSFDTASVTLQWDVGNTKVACSSTFVYFIFSFGKVL